MGIKTGEVLFGEESDANGGDVSRLSSNAGATRRAKELASTETATYHEPRRTGTKYEAVVAKYSEHVNTIAEHMARNSIGGRKGVKNFDPELKADAERLMGEAKARSKNTPSVIRVRTSERPGGIVAELKETMPLETAVMTGAAELAARKRQAMQAQEAQKRKKTLRMAGGGVLAAAVLGGVGFGGYQFLGNSSQTPQETAAGKANDKVAVSTQKEKPTAFGDVICTDTAKFKVTKAHAGESNAALTAMEAKFGDEDFSYVTDMNTQEQKNFLNAVQTQLNPKADINEAGTYVAPIDCVKE